MAFYSGTFGATCGNPCASTNSIRRTSIHAPAASTAYTTCTAPGISHSLATANPGRSGSVLRATQAWTQRTQLPACPTSAISALGTRL